MKPMNEKRYIFWFFVIVMLGSVFFTYVDILPSATAAGEMIQERYRDTEAVMGVLG